jgi:hypothetical protein
VEMPWCVGGCVGWCSELHDAEAKHFLVDGFNPRVLNWPCCIAIPTPVEVCASVSTSRRRWWWVEPCFGEAEAMQWARCSPLASVPGPFRGSAALGGSRYWATRCPHTSATHRLLQHRTKRRLGWISPDSTRRQFTACVHHVAVTACS